MPIYTLYVKTHKVTGIKYLGQTTKNPNTYKGSGIDWKIHIKEWGNNVITEILYQGDDRTEMKRLGRHYSNLWKVDSSNEWANRIPETGGGTSPSEKTRKLLSEKLTGKKKPTRTPEHNKKLGDASRWKSKTKTSEGLKQYYLLNGYSKEAADKASASIKKWYVDNPVKAKEKAKKVVEYNEKHPEKLKIRRQKISDTKLLKQRNRYIKIVPLVLAGESRHQILKQTGYVIKNSDIEAIKNRSHRVFHIFPELKQSL